MKKLLVASVLFGAALAISYRGGSPHAKAEAPTSESENLKACWDCGAWGVLPGLPGLGGCETVSFGYRHCTQDELGCHASGGECESSF